MLYATQEAIKASNLEKITVDTFKSEQLRALIMRMIEGQMRFSGFTAAMAIIGNKFSYETKSSKKTMFIFEVGAGGTYQSQVFHILIYDLAYINVASARVVTEQQFQKNLSALKQKLPKGKQEGLLCPNKAIQTV